MFWKSLLFASLLFCQVLSLENGARRQDSNVTVTGERDVDASHRDTRQALEEYEQKLMRIKQKISGLHQIIVGFKSATAGGATFTRWGLKACTTNSPRLYSGVTAGGADKDSGSAAEYICPPVVPHYWPNKVILKEQTAAMYGSRYQTTEWRNYDVPCTFCRSFRSRAVFMIPGRTDCYKGMTREYFGYLMSGKTTSTSSTQYICVDVNQEGMFSSRGNNDAKLLYHVVSSCGSLKCPPYERDRAMSCAVCSK